MLGRRPVAVAIRAASKIAKRKSALPRRRCIDFSRRFDIFLPRRIGCRGRARRKLTGDQKLRCLQPARQHGDRPQTAIILLHSITPACLIDRSGHMKFLGYAYRFLSNFVFLSMVYFSLNFMEKYQSRVIIAVLVLAYAGMRAATTMRSFYFFQRIERLELE